MFAAELLPDLTKFKQYTKAKQAVAYEVRSLAEFLRRHVGERESEACRQLMVRLAEDRFTLAVVGQFKRGKSSLMNAIIGRALLPTGVLPLTSAITVLKYGPRDRLTVQRDGALYPEEVPVSSLADFVTEKGNPGNMKKIARACIEIPSTFLRRGLEFVDTPGIGSAIEANTATTYGFLPQSDALIFVTSVETPLTGAETHFLKSIREHVRKIFFVVNKIDLAAESDSREILDFVSENLARETGAEEVRVFPVSSLMALESKLSANDEEYARSGLKALQQALSEFLSNEKTATLLISVLDKVIHLADGAYRELSLLRSAGEVSQEEAQEKISTLGECFQTLQETRRKSIDAARKRVMSWARGRISSEISLFSADETPLLLVEMYETLSGLRWKLASSAAREAAHHTLAHLKRDLDDWTRAMSERLPSEVVDVLRQEWTKLEPELNRIPVAAAKVLQSPEGASAVEEDTTEIPIHWALTRPDFTNIDWNPSIPFLHRWLPVFVSGHVLRDCLTSEMEGLMNASTDYLRKMFMNGVCGAMDKVETEIEKRAAAVESRIVQAMKGKRFSKSIDGHWQLLDLNKEGLYRGMEELKVIEKRLSSVRYDILHVQPAPGGEASLGPNGPTAPPPLPAPQEEIGAERLKHRMVYAPPKPDIRRDLNTRGCPVCDRMIDMASQFFGSWQYALATQERAQQEHAASLGFCPLHAWQQEAMASPQGLSQGLPKLMERISADLSRLAVSGDARPGDAVLAMVQRSEHCKACGLMRDVEKRYIKDLAAFLKTAEGQKTYADSQGLCLHHLGMLVQAIGPGDEIRFLLEHAARRFAEISEDMQNYALKRDALRGHTRNLDEEDAYIRGIVHSIGAKRVCFPWEPDAEI